jgi:diguanylate cyclase (GGDEF)-like protein
MSFPAHQHFAAPIPMKASFVHEQAQLWRDLSAVAYALIDADGRLIESNRGFDLLLPAEVRGKTGSDVRAHFVSPDFTALLKADGKNLERKTYTVGVRDGPAYALNGWFLAHEQNFMFLAEHDISGLDKASDQLVDVNKEISRLKRDALSANRRLKVREQQMRDLSLMDSLTGLGNRRRLEDAIEAAISQASRHKRLLSVVMIDLDDFKSVNERFGHDAGDRAIRAVADVLKKHSRKSDQVTRSGGEEFVVLMPETDMKQAKATAERIRKEVSHLNVPPIDEQITVSFGVTQFVEEDTAKTLLARIGDAMVQAKVKGRNRVEGKRSEKP